MSKKLTCRCYAIPVEGGYQIEAEAFLCPQQHKQGAFIALSEERYARLVEDEWERAEKDYYEGV